MRKSRAFFVGLVVGMVLAGLSAVSGRQPFPPQVQIAITQLTTGVIPFTNLRNAASAYINWGSTSGVNGYGFRDNAGTIEVKNSAGAWGAIVAGATLPTAAPFITRTLDGTLSNEFALSSLATAILVNTTTTGIPTAYAGTSCTNQFVRSLSAIGAATCASVILTTDTTGTLTAARGGTGLTTGTSGGILAFTGTTTIASSALLAANQLMLGGGAGVVPATLGSLGTTTTVLHGNAAGIPTFAAVNLAADVTGTLPAANGGSSNAFFAVSGPAASVKTFTFPNASSTVLTTNAAVTAAQGGTGNSVFVAGDLIQATGVASLARLAATSTGNALISGGVGVISSWGKIGLTTHISGTLGPTNGGTGFASYAIGDLLTANSTISLAPLADVAVGSVLISGGVGVIPAWSATPRATSLHLGSANLTFSGTAPTISSGFGTSPAIVAGTATAFTVNVGTGGTATAGVIGMPTATTGWSCHVENLTGTLGNLANARTVQTASTTTTVSVESQTISTGAALAWTASDVLTLLCAAY